MKSHRQVKRDVFLDSDNLLDLSLLFNIVRDQTDTLVVLYTQEILFRPWYVGTVRWRSQTQDEPQIRVILDVDAIRIPTHLVFVQCCSPGGFRETLSGAVRPAVFVKRSSPGGVFVRLCPVHFARRFLSGQFTWRYLSVAVRPQVLKGTLRGHYCCAPRTRQFGFSVWHVRQLQ